MDWHSFSSYVDLPLRPFRALTARRDEGKPVDRVGQHNGRNDVCFRLVRIPLATSVQRRNNRFRMVHPPHPSQNINLALHSVLDLLSRPPSPAIVRLGLRHYANESSRQQSLVGVRRPRARSRSCLSGVDDFFYAERLGSPHGRTQCFETGSEIVQDSLFVFVGLRLADHSLESRCGACQA